MVRYYGLEAQRLPTRRAMIPVHYMLDGSKIQTPMPISVYQSFYGHPTTRPLLPAYMGKNIQRGSVPMRPGLTTTIQYPYQSRTMSGQSIVRSKRFIPRWHPKYQVG